MLPRRLGSAQSEAERARWRVVRLSDCAPLEGDILEADVDSGVATMRVPGADGTSREVKHELGPGGLAIVGR
jgi:hypothetical protein